MNTNELTERIIGAAITVHRELGPGLLESAYDGCLALELAHRGLSFQQQVPLSVVYRHQHRESVYRIDFVVEHKVVVELKSVAAVGRLATRV